MDAPRIDVLISADDIARRVDALAGEIVADLPAQFLVVVILKGSFVFAADLIRALERAGASAQVDFITLSSYRDGTVSGGRVEVTHDLSENVAGRDVLVVEDILESGGTLAFACDHLKRLGASGVRTCLLLDKPEKRRVRIEADYVGFTIGPEFVVGYGLDLAHRYRGLPYIGVIRSDSSQG